MDIFLQDVLIKICSDGPRPSEGGREGVWAGRQAEGVWERQKGGTTASRVGQRTSL